MKEGLTTNQKAQTRRVLKRSQNFLERFMAVIGIKE